MKPDITEKITVCLYKNQKQFNEKTPVVNGGFLLI